MKFENLPNEVKEIVETDSFKDLMRVSNFGLGNMFFQYVKRDDKLKGLFLTVKKNGVKITVASKCHKDDRFNKEDAFVTCFAKILTDDYTIPLSFKKDFKKYQERTANYYKEEKTYTVEKNDMVDVFNRIIGSDVIPTTKDDINELTKSALNTFSGFFNKGKEKVKSKVKKTVAEQAIKKLTGGKSIDFSGLLDGLISKETQEKVAKEVEKEITPSVMADLNEMLQGIFTSNDVDTEKYTDVVNENYDSKDKDYIDDEVVEDESIADYLDNLYPDHEVMIIEGLDDAYAGVIENGNVINVLYNRLQAVEIIFNSDNVKDESEAEEIIEALKSQALEISNGPRFIKG